MARSKGSKQREWTKEEIRRLKALSQRKMSATQVARTLNRSLDSTKKKASRLGLSLGTTERWTDDDVRRLRKFAKEGRSLSFIEKQLKRTGYAVIKAASNFHIPLYVRRRKP